MEVDAGKIYKAVKELTGTGLARVVALACAVHHIVIGDALGDLVECGVWKGGSVMAMALTLMELGAERDIWLYDTFEGMTEPQPIDGKRALQKWEERKGDWCQCPIEEVMKNVYSTGYPKERFHFIEGKVEDTIPATVPERIALLRLDTDWYSSTKHELVHLFPLVSRGGVLIIDDYMHWPGTRLAVDEYISEHIPDLFLERIDKSARIAYVI